MLGAVLAANPLTIRAAWFGTADALSLAPLVLAFALVARRRLGWAAVALGSAILLKQFAIVAVPFLGIVAWQTCGRDATRRAGLAALGVVVAGFLPFLVWGPVALFRDTVEFGAGAYRVVGYGLSNLLVRADLVERTGSYPFVWLAILVWLPLTALLCVRLARERVDQVRGLEDPRDPEEQEPRHARDERRRPVLAITREAHAQDDRQRQPDQDGQPDERVAAGALDQVGADEQVREAVADDAIGARRRTRTCRGQSATGSHDEERQDAGGEHGRAPRGPRVASPRVRTSARPRSRGTARATTANCLIRIAVPSAAAAQPRRRRATSPNARTSGARDSASAVPNQAARSVSGLTASTAPSTSRSQGGPGNAHAAASIARLARQTRKRTSSSGAGSRRQTVASSAVPGR